MSLSEFCVRRPVFATMLVMSLVVVGIFSFRDLGVDLFPRADPATVNITVQLPGASPTEMATSVVEPFEEALSGLPGIDELRSRIDEGVARITVRFVLERDINDAANDVREKVAGAMRRVPPQVLAPVIQKVDPDSEPVLSVVLSSSTMSLRTLTELADKDVRRAIESADGVGQVDLSGGRAREMHVVLDIDKLNAYSISIDQVVEAIQKENIDVPGGTIEQGKAQLLLRTLGRIDAASEFQRIIVATVNGTPIRISDLGHAEDTTERPQTAAWMDDGRPAVMLEVRRASGENTIEVVDRVKARLAGVRRLLPAGVTLTIIKDDSRFILASIASLEEHLLWGSLFAAIVVMAFIRNIRAVLISAIAIPTSIVSTFTLMRLMDFTLNNMTLLALTLAVGIVIDDAIVVLENIFRYLEQKRADPVTAAIQGTREVALAVTATTLSLAVIFVPVAFMTGYARRFIYPFGWTMAFAILVSLLVSLTLTPMLSSRFLRLSEGKSAHQGPGPIMRFVEHWYTRSLEWSLSHPKTIVAVSVACLLMTVPLNRMVGRTFIPNEDMGEFIVHMDAPEGTSLEGMAEIARELAGKVRVVPGIAEVHQSISGRVSHLHLFAKLTPIEERTITQDEVVAKVRQVLAATPGYKPIVATRTALGGGENGSFAIQLNMLGPDVTQLSEYAIKLAAAAQKVPSLVDPKANVNNSNPELHVVIDRSRAADLGVRMSMIGSALRLMVSGDDEVSTFRDGTEQYPVKMRVLESQRRNMEAIGRLTIPSANGPVRVDSVAHLERGFGPTQIQRFGRRFSVSFLSDVAPGYALDQATNDVRKLLADLHMPPEYGYRIGGQSRILDAKRRSIS